MTKYFPGKILQKKRRGTLGVFSWMASSRMSEQNIISPARSANPDSIFFQYLRPDFSGDYLARFSSGQANFHLTFSQVDARFSRMGPS
jgi:hypothetical protein